MGSVGVLFWGDPRQIFSRLPLNVSATRQSPRGLPPSSLEKSIFSRAVCRGTGVLLVEWSSAGAPHPHLVVCFRVHTSRRVGNRRPFRAASVPLHNYGSPASSHATISTGAPPELKPTKLQPGLAACFASILWRPSTNRRPSRADLTIVCLNYLELSNSLIGVS